ncbi:hypothetical protein [Streptomyces sp. NPDC003863]
MWKHEAGRVYPSQHYQNLYSAMYGRSEAELGFRLALPGEETASQDTEAVRGEHPAQAGPLEETSTESSQGETAVAIQRALRLSAYAGITSSPEVAEQLYDEIVRLSLEYPHSPTAVIIGELTQLQGIAFSLTERDPNPSKKRDLYFLSGVISGLLAEANEDLGNFSASRVHARTAYICAEQSDHNALRSWARFQQMNTAFWSGSYQEAIQFADRCDTFIESVSGSGRARIYATKARALAAIQDLDAARAALELADRAREQAVPDLVDEIGGHVSYPYARQLYHTANVLLASQDRADEAESAAGRALEACAAADSQQRSYIWESTCRVDLATARLLRGDADGAVVALEPVLALPPAQRAENLRTSLQKAHRLLTQPRLAASPVARDTRLEIEEFCQFTVRTGLS